MPNDLGSAYVLRTVTLMLSEAAPGEAIDQPTIAARLAGEILRSANADETVEQALVIAIDSQKRFIGFKLISTGTRAHTPVDPGVVFRSLLLLDAAAFIMVHTRPTGELTPSADDIALTRRLIAVGKLVGVECLDHVILSGDRRSSASIRDLRRELFADNTDHGGP